MNLERKNKLYCYFILSARVLLAWTFFDYGYAKLTGGQFGISPEDLNLPLKDISLFKLSFYLSDFDPFKTFVGVSQIVCAILLLINRTVLLGALMFVPIAINIIVFDITYMSSSMSADFSWRLGLLLFLDGAILLYHREQLREIWDSIWNHNPKNYKFPFWAYLLLPFVAVMLNLLSLIPKALVLFFQDPETFLEGIGAIPKQFGELVRGLVDRLFG